MEACQTTSMKVVGTSVEVKVTGFHERLPLEDLTSMKACGIDYVALWTPFGELP